MSRIWLIFSADSSTRKTKIKTKGPILNISVQICESDFKSGNTVCMCTAAFYREIWTEIKIDESS